jgi:hypothetical protein
MKQNTFFIFIFLLSLSSLSLALDSLEVIMTFEDSLGFRINNTNRSGSDLNNDGYDDLIRFTINNDIQESRLLFYFGSANPDPIPDLDFNVEYGQNYPSWGGDLNNDGYKDIVYNSFCNTINPGDIYICLGGDTIDIEPELILHGENYAPDPFNLRFRGCNPGVDFNGDGYDDILAGGTGPDFFFNGQVDLFFGGEEIDTIPDFHLQGATLDQFGLFKTVGDINGDGYCDLIASRSIEFDGPLKYEIYLGGPDMDTIMDYELPEIWLDSKFPCANGDINGDGYDDLIISGVIDTIHAITGVYFGNESGQLSLNTIIDSTYAYANMFYTNINNDEFDDIAMTVLRPNSNYSIEIYYGNNEFDTFPDIIIEGNVSQVCFGKYCCNLGDFNGDGKNEIIVNNGEPYNTANVYTLAGGQSVDENYELGITNYEIINACPNPFTDNTNIHFSVKNSNNIQLDIYNIKGQRVKTLIDSKLMKGGNHEITWTGTNSRNKNVSSGIYFIKLRTEKCVNVKKIIKISP